MIQTIFVLQNYFVLLWLFCQYSSVNVYVAMGYDGNLSVKIAQEGLSLSEKIIGHVETRLVKE